MNGFILKLTAWIIALLLVTLPVIGVLNGWFAAERWPVRYVRIDAEFNHVSAEQIRTAAAVHLGNGFFAVRLDELRTAIAALPWVEAVEVRKHWPDTIELRVAELQPFAHWGADRIVSRNGGLFSVPGSEAIQGLPQLEGPDDALGTVLDFYTRSQHVFNGSGMIVNGVMLSGRGSWKLVLNSGAELILGRDHSFEHLQRFVAVFPRLASSHSSTFVRADLRYTNGFAIQWAAPLSVIYPSLNKFHFEQLFATLFFAARAYA